MRRSLKFRLYRMINRSTRGKSINEGAPEDNGLPINRKKDENMEAEWRHERLDKVPSFY